MEAHQRNAFAVARFLHDHPRVRRTYYPGLPDDPGHAPGRARSRSGFGGMVSFDLDLDALDAGPVLLAAALLRAGRVARGGGVAGGAALDDEPRRDLRGGSPRRRHQRGDDPSLGGYRGSRRPGRGPGAGAAPGLTRTAGRRGRGRCADWPSVGRSRGHNRSGREAGGRLPRGARVEAVMDETTILKDRTNGSATLRRAPGREDRAAGARIAGVRRTRHRRRRDRRPGLEGPVGLRRRRRDGLGQGRRGRGRRAAAAA